LVDWGALYPAKMRYHWQYWRLVTPLFLSNCFQQFVFNSVALVLLGFILEATGIGFINMAIIFLGSGIGGSFFSAVCSSDLAVGSDIAYFGFVSALLAAAIVNWKALEPLGMMRLCLVMMIVFLFVILLLFTNVQQPVFPGFVYYDIYAHFGSSITGLFLGLMFMRRARRAARVQESSFEKLCFKIGAAGLLFFFALLITLWFTVVQPI
jgi:membrane associated rhomboid family serine protease